MKRILEFLAAYFRTGGGRVVQTVPECTCAPCTSGGTGHPTIEHCAACCFGTLIAEYDPDCPAAEHREMAARQFPTDDTSTLPPSSGLRSLFERIGIDTAGKDITVDGQVVDAARARDELDEHYADARAVVDAGRATVDRYDADRAGATTDVRPLVLAPEIAPAPPAETGVNVDLLRRVLVHITENPDDWDQWTWWELDARSSCGTTGCFAGWAVHFTHPGARRDFPAGEVEVGGELQHIQYVARRALRLTPTQATGLFSANNTLRDLWEQAEYLSHGAIVPPAELPDGS